MYVYVDFTDLIFITRHRRENLKRQQRRNRGSTYCTEKQMDCARFIEENGTLENQRGALSLSLSFLHPSTSAEIIEICKWNRGASRIRLNKHAYIVPKRVKPSLNGFHVLARLRTFDINVCICSRVSWWCSFFTLACRFGSFAFPS